MTSISDTLDSIASFIADLMGCEEGDTECLKKARKYASWLVLVVIAAIATFIIKEIYKLYKGRGK